MDIEKLKVVDLRSELTNRGLDSKGNKAVLVSRLQEALKRGDGNTDISIDDTEDVDEAEENTENTILDPVLCEKSDEVTSAETLRDTNEKQTPQAANNIAESVEPDLSSDGNIDESLSHDETCNNADQNKVGLSGSNDVVMEDSVSKDSGSTTSGPNKVLRRGPKRKLNDDEPFVVTIDEPDIDSHILCLDWFNSDLNLRICKDGFMIADPFSKEGWGYVWAGTRATHGFNKGKLCFEVKLIENLESKLEGEKHLHELRLGWSSDSSSLQLGESDLSFAYCGSAKKAHSSEFIEYGESFVMGDVVASFIDLDSDPVVFTFSKNGVSQGVAFEISREVIGDVPLFPHICSKNVKFEVNFGRSLDGKERQPWFPPVLEDYEFVGSSQQDKVRGMERIKSREECEVILTVGLPASGKTTWVQKYVSDHPEKRYNVLGIASLISKMTVDGEERKKNHEGKWDYVIQKCTRCLQDWLRIASQRNRNFIIDQTNTSSIAQKRKVRHFEGMIRKAVVIIPSDEEYKKRSEAQEKAEKKDVPDNAVMGMKALLALPEEGEGSPFSEVIFAELDRVEAEKLVAIYNSDAKDKGYGKRQDLKSNKRYRPNNFKHGMIRGSPFYNSRYSRSGLPPSRSFRGGIFRGGSVRPFITRNNFGGIRNRVPMMPPRGRGIFMSNNQRGSSWASRGGGGFTKSTVGNFGQNGGRWGPPPQNSTQYGNQWNPPSRQWAAGTSWNTASHQAPFDRSQPWRMNNSRQTSFGGDGFGNHNAISTWNAPIRRGNQWGRGGFIR